MRSPPATAGWPGRGGRSGPRPAPARARRRRPPRAPPPRNRSLITGGTMSSRPPWVKSVRARSGRRSIGEASASGAPPRNSSTTPFESPSSAPSARSSTPAWLTTPSSGTRRRQVRGEVAARAVADGHAPGRVERERLRRRDDVVERRGHAAAVAEPPVLDVPRRPPARGEVGAQRVHQRPVVARAPEAAVEHDRHAGRLAGGPEQLAELRGRPARRRASQAVTPRLRTASARRVMPVSISSGVTPE